MRKTLPVLPDTSSDEGSTSTELNNLPLSMDEQALTSKILEDKPL